jgi:hypothetical protein
MWEDLNLQNPERSRFYGPLQLTVSASHAHHGSDERIRTSGPGVFTGPLTFRVSCLSHSHTSPQIKNLAESIRVERMTPHEVFRVSSAAPSTTGTTLRIHVHMCRLGASNPQVRRHCVLNAARLPIFRQAGTSLAEARGVEPLSPKALESKSSAVVTTRM